MSRYQIFSDSSCDLNIEDFLMDYQIPFVVSFDGENYYKEKAEISTNDFYLKLDGVFPKTSVPSVQDFIDKFTPVLENGEDIICVTISGELSSSIQSAKTASLMLATEFPNRKIHVEDTRLATIPQGLIVSEMLKMKNQGIDFDTVVTYCQNAKKESDVFFTVGDASYLQKGGRIGSVVLKSVKALNLKPVVCLDDGKVSSIGVGRGERSAIDKLVEHTYKKFKDEDLTDYSFCIGYTDDTAKVFAMELEKNIKEKLPNISFNQMLQIGATIGAHTGKGTFGVAYTIKSSI